MPNLLARLICWVLRRHAWAKHNEWAWGVECHKCKRPYNRGPEWYRKTMEEPKP